MEFNNPFAPSHRTFSPIYQRVQNPREELARYRTPPEGHRESPPANFMQLWLRNRRAQQGSPRHLQESKESERSSRRVGRPPRSPGASPVVSPTGSPVGSPRMSPRVLTTSLPMLESLFEKKPLEDYWVGCKLGEGAYSVVREGQHKVTRRKIAIKTFDKIKLLQPSKQKLVYQEITALRRLRHSNIIKLYERIQTETEYHLILEHVGGCSLHGFLKQRLNRRVSEDEARVIFKQLVEAVAFCHENSITHRDIKLENVIVTQDLNVKLIDFGFATCMPAAAKAKLFCGTPSYMAPEIILKKEYRGPPVDIWALGVLLFILLTGSFPFRGPSEHELYRRIVRCQYVLPEYVSSSAKALLTKLLRIDPSKRPAAHDLLKETWVKSKYSISDSALAEGAINLKSCSVGGDPIDLNIIDSIVLARQKNLGYRDSQIAHDLNNQDSQIYKMYSNMKSKTGRYPSFN